MNPTTQPEAQSTGRWGRMAWIPIAVLLAAIIAAKIAGLHEPHESPTLLLALSFTFYTLVSLGILYLIGRSFLASGSPGLLLLECGVVLWSLAGTVGDFVSHGDANVNVTIFNVGILLAGLCHLAGAILALSPQRVLRLKPLWLSAGCVFALGALWLVAQAALSGWLPAFFIPGHGGTLVRYAVLLSAIAMFVLSAGVLRANQPAARIPFTSWYSLALLLLAVGLFGIMIQLSLGSVVNWLSRTAQWLGGTYLLFAAVASLRQSHLPLLPPEKKSRPAYYRYAVAVAVVLASAAIRLAFLSVMGMQAPFLVFFPAVTFAAIYGGPGPGLVATVTAAILVDYFWIEPVYRFSAGRPSAQIAMGIFVLCGAMIAWVTHSMHRARARASAAETQALLAAERERMSQQRQLALDAARMGWWHYDPVTRIASWDDRYREIFGVTGSHRANDEILAEIIHPDDLPGLWAKVEAALNPAAPQPFAEEYRIRRPDGVLRWIEAYGVASFDGYGATRRATSFVGTVADVTERKRAEEALRHSEQRWATTLASIGDGVIATDVAGRIAFMNAVAEDLTGWKLFEASQKPVTEVFNLINEHTRKEVENPVTKVLRAGSVVGLGNHTLLVRKNGTEVPIDDSGAPIKDENGNISGVVLIFRDVTERRRAEDALRKDHDELETRVQERTSELSQAVQRLRSENILRKQLEETLRESETQVRFFASQCLTAQETERKRVAGELHDSIAASLSAMRFRIDKIMEEIKQGRGGPESLQDLGSKVTEINHEVRRIMADLRPSVLDDLGIIAAMNWFCREYQKTYSHIAVENQIGISEPEVPDSLKTPIFRISQEAMNNIAKYSQASVVNLSIRKDDGKILLAIKDNGRGFDLATVRRGMGLSTMKERAQLSGGTFQLESTKGKGTTIQATWNI